MPRTLLPPVSNENNNGNNDDIGIKLAKRTVDLKLRRSRDIRLAKLLLKTIAQKCSPSTTFFTPLTLGRPYFRSVLRQVD